jgi:hypothetical protein
MTQTVKPSNLTAQLLYRATGNPVSTLPSTAISNCFPGLEFDFRNLWRRAFVGIVLMESNNYVVEAEDPLHTDLLGHRLLRVDGRPTMVRTSGPQFPGGSSVPLNNANNPNAVSFMEWSNSLAQVLHAKQGQTVECYFTPQPSPTEVIADDVSDGITRILTVRTFFVDDTAALSPDLLHPVELTQGLCEPWQNDYRECACYYWAASRPDYVNVEPGEDGLSHGDMWMAKKRTGEYIPDDRSDSRLVSYDDLFKDWEKELSFIIGGRDADAS